MHYLIDGHNLIPKLAGMSLADPEDERKLIHHLNEFCRLGRHRVTVFFDGAPAGMSGGRKIGLVEVVSVPRGTTADAAIYQRLRKMKGSARNIAVVSSDRQVQASASASRATVIEARAFADLMVETVWKGGNKEVDAPSKPSPGEVDTWLKIFQGDAGGEGDNI